MGNPQDEPADSFPYNRVLNVPPSFETREAEYFYFLDGLFDTSRKPSPLHAVAALAGTFPELRVPEHFDGVHIEANLAYQVFIDWTTARRTDE